MQNIDLKTIGELHKHITITIIDDKNDASELLRMSLEQEGLKNMLVFDNCEIPDNDLERTDILFVDYDLGPKSNLNGLDFIKYVKDKYGDDIETILFTGNDIGMIKEEVGDINISGIFKKPVEGSYIKLWLKAVTEKIWFKQILDNDPDEIVIRSNTGTILYADKEKERIFGKDLIGKKCFNVFENRGATNKICDECPGEVVLKENRPIRREWKYTSRGNKHEHRIHQKEQYLDINVAPLKDKNGNNLGLIEISRDITLQKILNMTIQEMEHVDSFNERIEIFLAVFRKLNFKRARLYFIKDDSNLFRLVHCDGHHENLEIIEFNFDDDFPTMQIKKFMKSLLFIRDIEDDNRNYELDKVNSEVYWVGKNKIFEYSKLQKDSWFDIPLFSSGKMIGKVSIDGWESEKDTPGHYELSAFSEFGKIAGQVIENAKQKDIIKRKEKTNKAILELSKEITNISKRSDLLQNTLELIGKTLDVEMCSIFIFNEKSKVLEMKKRWLIISDDNLNLESYPHGSDCITMKAYFDGKPKIINDFDEKVNSILSGRSSDFINMGFVESYEKCLNKRLINCIFAPLKVGDKKIGLLRAMNKNRKNYFGEIEFDSYDLEAFELLAGQIAVANYNLIQYEKLNEERETVKKYHKEAAQALKEKEVFISQLSHELLSPITEIVYKNDLFLSRYEREKENEKELAFILIHDNLDAAFNLKRILGNIELGFGDLDSSNYRVELVESPHVIIQDVVQMSEQKAYAEKQIKFKLDIVNIPSLYLNKNHIQQVFINLIKNAIQYSNDNSIISIYSSIVSLNLDNKGIKAWVEIVCANDGIGILEKDREMIFDLKYRGKNAIYVRPSGTGIGLYIVKKIIRAHQGECIVKRYDKPTELAIYLPLIKSKD